MQLNIKDSETHILAQSLAKATGETMTEAVTLAIRERLERARDDRKSGQLREAEAELCRKAEKLSVLREISAQTAELLKGPPLDHAEMLNDENGLPKGYSIHLR
jgi:antitoxin VapB